MRALTGTFTVSTALWVCVAYLLVGFLGSSAKLVVFNLI